ncbi:MAG: NAD(P)H-dependent oxidoreductase [Endomicrobia bacterium]|nr:NAD(P)H-dependent oxidoreductase [Endomicrobiia bacterium]
MIKKIFISAVLVFVSVSLSCARDICLAGRFIPKDGKTLLFAGQTNSDSDAYVKAAKSVPAGFMIYTSLAQLDGLDENADFGTGETSGKHILSNYPGAALQIGLYLVNSLDAVIDGSLDANIEKLGKWIKAAKVPVFLRIGYEFDFPENGYDPDKYVKAYRHIADKLDDMKVTNAAYVWHSYASLNPRGIEAWYPGDEYVDWCAISYFANPQWIPMVKFAQRHSKPLMIAECAPMLGLDLKKENKVAWHNKLFRFIESNNVKALCCINSDWDATAMFGDKGWGNSRIDDTAEITELWIKNTSDKRFVQLKDMPAAVGFNPVGSVLIIFCHPDNKNSSNAAILGRIKSVLEKNEIKYAVRDLYSMKFNPALSKSELAGLKNKKYSKEVLREQKLIKDAGAVIFIYPIWWGTTPAMLKGYIDRVFSISFAADSKDSGGIHSIKYKDAYVFNTMGMSKDAFEERNFGQLYEKTFDDGALSVAGFNVVKHKYFWSLPTDDDTLMKSYLDEVEKTVGAIE